MRAPRRWGWILLFASLAAFLLFALVLLAVRFSNRTTLKGQLEEIAQRGEPVELPKGEPTEAGEATLAWVKQFQDCTGPNDEWTVTGREELEALLALPEAKGISGEDRMLVQRLSACLAPGAAWDEDGDHDLPAHARALLAEGSPEEQWDDCARDWIVSRALCYRPVMAVLAGEIPAQPLDLEPGRGPERLCKQIYALAVAARGSLVPVFALAARGDSSAIVRRVKCACTVEALASHQPGLISLLFRVFISNMSLSACGIALAQIPPETDLDELGALFEACGDERTDLRRALLEERAIGNEIYVDYGFGRTPFDTGSKTILNSVVSCDQPYFLGVHEQLFACLDRTSSRDVAAGLAGVQAELEQHFESWRKYTTMIAGMILARYPEPWQELIGRRARIELLRAGLRARKLAPDAALDEARRGRDPFTEGNLHGRLDPDGLLTIWSVGRDGEDGGGPSALERERRGIKEHDCDDLVIRVRMR